ncbi:MAG: HD domain-containing phosphohydrolase [Anaerovoracaceae bacterium]|jgi:diguanylate cyclase (GGDEF)-like protein/putative nucleotidyltransferase with HDIG domain
MDDFTYIPIIALCCYAFLLLSFMAAKKSRIINSFLLVLSAMILWNGGSLLMRIQLWPSMKFWYDVSIIGLTLMAYAFYVFAVEYAESTDKLFKKIWLVLVVAANIINITTEFFLAPPNLVTTGNQVRYVYDISWPVAILFTLCMAMITHMLVVLIKFSRTNEKAKKQFMPIFAGIFMMFIGHLMIMTPFFKGFPTDILSGVANALFMFYALYKRRLFKLTLLVSRGIVYAFAAAFSLLVFSNSIRYIERFMNRNIPMLAEYSILVIALTFTVATVIIYTAMQKFIDGVFIKDEIAHAESIKKFSAAVAKSLNVKEILEELVSVIQDVICVKKVYVCIFDEGSQAYTMAHSTSALDRQSFSLQKDNPLVSWLTTNNSCLLMKDFKRTVAYKSMWEKEKNQLQELEIACFVPLKDEDELVGIVLLTGKEKNASFTYDDLNLLDSIDSIGTIAVKNSRMYEKAYLEARTDELTGLLNRKYFYEVIQREYEINQDRSLALIILNIDDFKLYNQLYGNKEGDIALQKIARIIKASVGNNGYVARYSGKEFAIILPLYDLLGARNLAESLRLQILNMNKRLPEGSFKTLTVSGGVCSIPYAASSVKELIHNADMAIYHVKRNGKNAIMVYSMGNNEVPSHKKPEGKKEDIYSEYAVTIYALTAAIDTKDHYTFSHSKNVAYYATELAYAYGLNQESVEIIREAALLHDIGKIGVPEHILNKPGKLTPDEYEIMKGHVENSIGIIRYLPSLDYVIPAVIGHHERFDGRGYPRGIAREDIPVSARILCIADAFDAMVSERSYKEPYSVSRAIEILSEQAGLQFDPKLAHIFVDCITSSAIKVNEENQMYEKSLVNGLLRTS